MFKETRKKLFGRTIFYGWWMTLAGALMNTIGAGLYMSGFTVWLLPLEREFNISRTASSLIFSFSRMEGGLQGPLTGICIDRWGPRNMMILSVILAATGFMLLPLANSYIVFLVLYVGVLSVGFHAGFNQAVMATVNRWFIRRRGMAFGIISVGMAMGGALITPVVAMIMESFGWRSTARISALAILIIALPLSFFMKGSPEEVGLLPDGDQPVKANSNPKSDRFVPVEGVDFTARQGFRSRTYWFLALGICFRIAAHAGVFVHIVPLMVWKGLDEAHGALMVAVISFCGVWTRLFMGWLGDLWSRERLTALAMLAGAVSLLLLLFGPGRLWVMIVFGVVYSVTDGAAGVTWAMLGDYFGRRAFATLRGGVNFVVSLGAVTTPIIAGRVFDVTGSYHWALLPFTALYLVTAVMFMFMRRPQ